MNAWIAAVTEAMPTPSVTFANSASTRSRPMRAASRASMSGSGRAELRLSAPVSPLRMPRDRAFRAYSAAPALPTHRRRAGSDVKLRAGEIRARLRRTGRAGDGVHGANGLGHRRVLRHRRGARAGLRGARRGASCFPAGARTRSRASRRDRRPDLAPAVRGDRFRRAARRRRGGARLARRRRCARQQRRRQPARLASTRISWSIARSWRSISSRRCG